MGIQLQDFVPVGVLINHGGPDLDDLTLSGPWELSSGDCGKVSLSTLVLDSNVGHPVVSVDNLSDLTKNVEVAILIGGIIKRSVHHVHDNFVV